MDHGGSVTPKGTALINHVWMTRLDDELYSGLDDGTGNGHTVTGTEVAHRRIGRSIVADNTSRRLTRSR